MIMILVIWNYFVEFIKSRLICYQQWYLHLPNMDVFPWLLFWAVGNKRDMNTTMKKSVSTRESIRHFNLLSLSFTE